MRDTVCAYCGAPTDITDAETLDDVRASHPDPVCAGWAHATRP